jgi:hypothetical protein
MSGHIAAAVFFPSSVPVYELGRAARVKHIARSKGAHMSTDTTHTTGQFLDMG